MPKEFGAIGGTNKMTTVNSNRSLWMISSIRVLENDGQTEIKYDVRTPIGDKVKTPRENIRSTK